MTIFLACVMICLAAMFKPMRRLVIAFLIICAIGAAMNAASDDEEQEGRYYCQMVLEGHWPDYKGRKDDCGI